MEILLKTFLSLLFLSGKVSSSIIALFGLRTHLYRKLCQRYHLATQFLRFLGSCSNPWYSRVSLVNEHSWPSQGSFRAWLSLRSRPTCMPFGRTRLASDDRSSYADRDLRSLVRNWLLARPTGPCQSTVTERWCNLLPLDSCVSVPLGRGGRTASACYCWERGTDPYSCRSPFHCFVEYTAPSFDPFLLTAYE